MKPAIRAGSREDIPRLLEIADESFTAAHWSPADYENLFAPQIVQESCLLVAEIDGKVQGFIAARGLDGDWEIENIVVTAGFQRQGLGAELLKGFLVLITRNRDGKIAAKAVHLEVRESNAAARQLYKTLGFVHSGRRKSYYSEPLEDAIILKLSF